MNKQFTDEQIKAYASAFTDKDAIWIEGEWKEIIKENNSFLVKGYFYEGFSYVIKRIEKEGGRPYVEGFLDSYNFGVDKQYRVTTLEHYELQGGEKIVWLGEEGVMRFTFGKIYDVKYRPELGAFVHDDNGYIRTLKSKDKEWAVIPRYEQVKLINTKNSKQPFSEELEKQSIYEQVANRHNITKEELSFILDECDNGRRKYIIDSLIALRNKWHESN